MTDISLRQASPKRSVTTEIFGRGAAAGEIVLWSAEDALYAKQAAEEPDQRLDYFFDHRDI